MSAATAIQSQMLFFGKLASRGDFVRSSAGSALIHSIDDWMSNTVQLMAEDPRWKVVYDAAGPVHFAILGSQSHAGLVGHLAASHDSSGRRFPFVMAASFEVPQPAKFIPYCPQALAPLWQRLDNSVRLAMEAEEFSKVQETLSAQPPQVEVREDALREPYRQFIQSQTTDGFEALLSTAQAPVSFRQTALALGMLLQPVLTQGHEGMSKGLVLPLPRDFSQLAHTLTLWTDLISRFFRRTKAELALFVTVHREQPVMVMGFHGASAATLRTVLDPDLCLAENVQVADAEWVEDWIASDYGLRKLSTALRDPSLSLAVAVDMFRETFLGE